MVTIKIKKAEKNMGDKSLFISFDFNYQILDFIKSLPSRIYNAQTREWEIPNLYFEKVKNGLLNLGQEIEVLHYEEANKPVTYNYQFKTQPLNHQLEAINYGLQRDCFLLADDMGLGKSKEALDICMIRKSLNQVSKCLIVCGVNALKWNWIEEIKKHTNENGWIIGQRKNKKGKIKIGSTEDKVEDLKNLCGNNFFMITNIETLRNNDFVKNAQKLIDQNKIQMIIFDEAHCCRNPKASQTKGLLKLKAKYLLPMSGTFMLNRPLDLFVPLCWTNYYKDSYWRFENSFINKDDFGNINGLKNFDLLRDILKNCMLRRKKEDVLDLPEKTFINEYIEMTDKQKDIYEEVMEGLRANIDKIRISHNPQVEIIRARQATGYPGILSSTCNESAKMNRLVELVEEISANGYKCLVFSNWAEMIEIAANYLEKYNPIKITGRYSEQVIEEEKNKFKNDSSCKVACGTIGKMGTGLTLTEANYVIFLDEPWTMGNKNQAADRVHRIGQKNNVTIITLICKDTIDEKVNMLVEKKGAVTDLLIDGKFDNSKLADFLLY